MESTTVTHNTFVIERTYDTPPDRVFAAFADPAKKRRWYADSHGVEEFEMDFRVGGHDTARFVIAHGPVQGSTITSDTLYQDIVPNRRIVTAYTMDLNGVRMSSSQSTFEFLPVKGGTKLVFTEQGAFFEKSDGPEMRQNGWRKLLEELAGVLQHSEAHA
jgi:uncharacterized protein YndB with AHSA1/START domain